MPEPKSTLSPLASVFAGEEVEVKLQTGDILTVRVRALPARQHIAYLNVSDEEVEAIKLCCTHVPGQPELPEGWIDALTDAAHVLLATKVKELNFTRSTATLKRRAEVVAVLRSMAPAEASKG